MSKRTYVCMILDESGSMAGVKEETISGYNEQLNVIRANAKDGGDTKVSLVTFGAAPDWQPHIVYWNGDVTKLLPLDADNYQPFGNTPMYDAVGLALDQLSKESKRGDVGFLVIIVSDGQENASKKYTSAQIAKTVKELEDTGKFTFVYIGSNQDLKKVGEQTGVNQNLAWASTKIGTMDMYSTLNSSTAAYFTDVRGTGSMRTDTFIQPPQKVGP